jgi:hypothetical protein
MFIWIFYPIVTACQLYFWNNRNIGVVSWQAVIRLSYRFHYSRQMDTKTALAALSAISQPARLDVFRLLVKQEPDGLPAGEIARRDRRDHTLGRSGCGCGA